MASKDEDWKEARELLLTHAKANYTLYEMFKDRGSVDNSDLHYNKYVALQTAAQFLKEHTPMGLAGYPPILCPQKSTAHAPQQPSTTGPKSEQQPPPKAT